MMTTPQRMKKKAITFEQAAPARARARVLRMPRIGDDLRLFAITFAGGFLFTALFIA